MEWTTIASFSSNQLRTKYLTSLVDNSEKYRLRSRAGKVLSGPLYRPWDVDDTDYNQPSYLPDEQHLEHLVQFIRESNLIRRQDQSPCHKPSPGRAADEIHIEERGGAIDHGDNTPDHDPWWVQIGG